jgi:hypothetical protein
MEKKDAVEEELKPYAATWTVQYQHCIFIRHAYPGTWKLHVTRLSSSNK